MTLPDERTRAVKYARDFLRDLIDPKKTPRVPRDIRTRALQVLRHYPADYHIDFVADDQVFAANPNEQDNENE